MFHEQLILKYAQIPAIYLVCIVHTSIVAPTIAILCVTEGQNSVNLEALTQNQAAYQQSWPLLQSLPGCTQAVYRAHQTE